MLDRSRTLTPGRHAALLGLATLAALGLAAPKAATAQTFTVSGSVSGAAPTFTYSYVVTPTTGSLGLLIFNFSDPSVTAGAAPSGFATLAAPPAAGIFQYYSTLAGGTATATTFTFTSPDGIGGTLGTSNVSTVSGSSGVAVVNGTTPAPAPEPSQTAALGLGVLGVAALALKARKRQAVA